MSPSATRAGHRERRKRVVGRGPEAVLARRRTGKKEHEREPADLRVDVVDAGETSVAVIVTTPHRKPAFEAALEGINRLKRLVPIWKKEYFADGEVWVEGEWDESVLKR